MSSITYTTQLRMVRQLRNIAKNDNVSMINWDEQTEQHVHICQWFSHKQCCHRDDHEQGFDLSKEYTAANNTAYMGERPPRLTAEFENVYVYCDVLEHVLVGDTKTPLLCILHRKGSDYGSEHVVFNPAAEKVF